MGARGKAAEGGKPKPKSGRAPAYKVLPTVAEASKFKVPPMPKRPPGGAAKDWSPEIKEWWKAIWTSPMASQWITSDQKGGLILLLNLHQLAHDYGHKPGEFIRLATVIRQHEIQFGLSPLDRMRQNWVIPTDTPEQAPGKPGAAPAAAPSSRETIGNVDPREILDP